MQRISGNKLELFAGYLLLSDEGNLPAKRYFILDKIARRLRYYEDVPEKLSPEHTEPLGSFDMDCVSQVEDLKGSRPKTHLCFVLHYYGSKHILQAQSWKEMEDWISVLKECSKISVDQKERNPNRVSIDGSYRAQVVGDNVVNIPICAAEGHGSRHMHAAAVVDDKQELVPPVTSSDAPSPDAVLSSCEPKHRQKVVKAGYCVKMGAVIKNWKRRYFVLDNENLAYYENESCKKAKKVVCLKGVVDCKAAYGFAANKDNLFEIVTNDRTYYIQTDSPDEMASWIDCIRSQVYKVHMHLRSRHFCKPVLSGREELTGQIFKSFQPLFILTLTKIVEASPSTLLAVNQTTCCLSGGLRVPRAIQGLKPRRCARKTCCLGGPIKKVSSMFEALLRGTYSTSDIAKCVSLALECQAVR